MILAPQDEKELADQGWADEVHTFRAASLQELQSPTKSIRELLAKAAQGLGLGRGSAIGYEGDEAMVPVPYAAMHVFCDAMPKLIQEAIPEANLTDATEIITYLAAVLTPGELNRVREACRVCEAAFTEGVNSRSGKTPMATAVPSCYSFIHHR